MKQIISEFLFACAKEKKGYIFVYHHSNYRQQYDFHLYPHIVLSLKQFEKYQDRFNSDIDYFVIPLILSDGYIYNKLKRMTKLKVGKPLINTEDDVKKVIQYCRKEEAVNIWMMHPRSQSDLLNQFRKLIPDEDFVATFDEELQFENDKNYHVVMLLMTKGEHYHELVRKIPNHISVSEILPLQTKIIKWKELNG